MASIDADRLAYLSDFLANFYNTDVLMGDRVSEEVVRASFNVAAAASAKGTHDCVPTWLTDFREDLAKIRVPTLVIHGTADRILPFDSTGPRAHAAVKGSRFLPIAGGPHCVIWTHAEEVNRELLAFLGERSPVAAS